jgi:hypothetical protein
MTQWGLDTLFNPAKRHMDEEKRRLQSTREQIGDNSGGKRIDLESGKVRIQRAEDGDGEGTEDGAAEGAAEAAVDAAPARAKRKKDAGEPSAAARRAAARRGRTL